MRYRDVHLNRVLIFDGSCQQGDAFKLMKPLKNNLFSATAIEHLSRRCRVCSARFSRNLKNGAISFDAHGPSYSINILLVLYFFSLTALAGRAVLGPQAALLRAFPVEKLHRSGGKRLKYYSRVNLLLNNSIHHVTNEIKRLPDSLFPLECSLFKPHLSWRELSALSEKHHSAR